VDYQVFKTIKSGMGNEQRTSEVYAQVFAFKMAFFVPWLQMVSWTGFYVNLYLFR